MIAFFVKHHTTNPSARFILGGVQTHERLKSKHSSTPNRTLNLADEYRPLDVKRIQEAVQSRLSTLDAAPRDEPSRAPITSNAYVLTDCEVDLLEEERVEEMLFDTQDFVDSDDEFSPPHSPA